MKKFYYSFTSTGTLKIWLAGCNEQPELLAQIEPTFSQTRVKHTCGDGMVPIRQNNLITGGLPVIIECLLYYQKYYNQN